MKDLYLFRSLTNKGLAFTLSPSVTTSLERLRCLSLCTGVEGELVTFSSSIALKNLILQKNQKLRDKHLLGKKDFESRTIAKIGKKQRRERGEVNEYYYCGDKRQSKPKGQSKAKRSRKYQESVFFFFSPFSGRESKHED
jgi:hypothetical protein